MKSDSKRFAGIIINSRSKDVDSSLYSMEPLGLEYVLSIAEDEGYENRLFDNLMFPDFENFVLAIHAFKPNIAGFSVFDCSRNDSLTVAKSLKEQGTLILFGGYHPSAYPEIALKKEVDFVVIGEAERTLPSLLQKINSLEPLLDIPFLAYKRNGSLYLDLISRPNEIKRKPLQPLRNEFYLRQKDTCLNYPAPSDQTGVAHIVINRGCVNRCYFCSSTSVFGNIVTEGSLSKGTEEIKELKERGINLIIIDDLNFTLNENFVEEFYQRMRSINSDGELFFEVFGNIERTSPHIIDMLYGAGVRKIGFGVESLNEDNLRFMRRNLNISKLKTILEKNYELGILTTCFYQIGYPQDTKNTINEDFERMINEKLFIPRIRISVATPSSGSPWHEQLKSSDANWPREEAWPLFDCSHLVYPHTSLKPEEIGSLRNEMERKYYQSDFYQKNLESFVKKHPHFDKVFEECRGENE